MSTSIYFRLKELPDFSLSKHSNCNSQSDVCEKNHIFIKQLHGLGVVMNMDFHLYYIFNPKIELNSKMNVILECRSRNDKDINPTHLYNIISSYAICEVYSLEYLDNGSPIESLEKYTGGHRYTNYIAVYKKQIYTPPNYADRSDDIKKCYYSISDWKIRKEPRFFNTLSLIGRLKHHVVLRIDAEVVENSEQIVFDINKKGIYKAIKNQSDLKLSLDNSKLTHRDESADDIAYFYETYMKEMTSSLQFRVALCVLSDYKDEGMMLVEALMSEVLEKGLFENDFQNTTSDKGFSEKYRLDSPSDYGKDDLFDNQKVWYMRSLYTAEELSAFFAFPYTAPNERLEIRRETDPSFELNDINIHIGVLNDLERNTNELNEMNVSIPIVNLCKHGYICGVPGSGKTYTMKHLIHTLNKNNIPFLVFEPAKKEYRGLYTVAANSKISRYGEFTENEKTNNIILFSPCANTLFPFHINPFEIPAGVTVSEHISTLYSVFTGAFSWPNPSANVLHKALVLTYKECNLYENVIISKKKKYNFPTISDLHENFKKVMEMYSYVGEVRNTIMGILESRIGSLMDGYVGEVFNIGYSSIAPNDWINKSVIMELEALTTEQANFISLLILSLIRLQLRKTNNSENKLRHVIFFEEAHNLIGPSAIEENDENASAKLAATVYIKNMLAEVRAYNEGIIIADQLPSAIAPEVLKNTSLKIAHRQSALDERNAISSVMSADQLQVEHLAQFTKGQALMSFESENLSKPFEIQVMPEFRYSGEMVSDYTVINIINNPNLWHFEMVKESIYRKNCYCMKMLEKIKEKNNRYLSLFLEESKKGNAEIYSNATIHRLEKSLREMSDLSNIFLGNQTIINYMYVMTADAMYQNLEYLSTEDILKEEKQIVKNNIEKIKQIQLEVENGGNNNQ